MLYNDPVKLAVILLLAPLVLAQNRFTPGLQSFLTVTAPVVALTHVRVIDGTGAAPVENQTIVIDHGKIAAVGSASSVTIPAGAQTLDYTGHTVIPGLVGMHEHLFYPSGGGIPMYNEMAFSFPRLYLASGITSARTGGSLEPYTDLNVKRLIDAGRMPGPHMFITGPYLEGPGSIGAQMHELTGPEDAVRLVDYWAAVGVTSFKAYMNITRAELKAAVDEAHKRGIKVTGHLCSVGFREAAEIGIDNLEHGLLVDTEFHPGKQPRRLSRPGRHAQRNGAARYRQSAGPRHDRRPGTPQRRRHLDAVGFRSLRWQPPASRTALSRCPVARRPP